MKDTELITFSNDTVGELRGFIKNGEPWFLAGQVCRCLGIKDTSRAVQQVTERLKVANYKGAISSSTLIETKGGKQKSIIIPEPYLYELIFASRKKKAIEFRTWVTTEVLPSIRKHGIYRHEGKLIHKSYTDTIRDKVAPKLSKKAQGFIYPQYQRLINKSLGLPDKNVKDSMSPEVLEKIAQRENMVNALLIEGKDYCEIKDLILKMSKISPI